MAAQMADRRVGPWGLTAPELSAASGLPEEDARRLLEDPEAALAELYELAAQRARKVVERSDRPRARWLERTRSTVAALLDLLDRDRAVMQVLLLYATGGGERLRDRREELLGQCCAFLCLDAQARGDSAAPLTRPSAEGALGAACGLLQNLLLAEPPQAALDAYGAVLSVLALPCLGPAAARRELERPAPRLHARRRGPRPVLDASPISRRLTPRMRSVMQAIAEHPGASNREVAELAGMLDQGQISKLLSRLHRRGLIEKLGDRRGRGAPNSWVLSELGEQVLL